MPNAITNVVGFDDGPFDKGRKGHSSRDGEAELSSASPERGKGWKPFQGFHNDVLLVGAVFARTRLDGVLSGRIRRDGRNATSRMAELVLDSQFDRHVRAVLLSGIAVGGFNVVDIHRLHVLLERPVIVVARRLPRYPAIRRALQHVAGGDRKWALIQAAGPMEPVAGIYVQRVGISVDDTLALLKATTLHGKLPEPLRVAHLIAGGIAAGRSRGRA